MKFLFNSIRFFVSILFIVSGFVKLIDPLGFSYKLEEYFSESVLNLPFLIPLALIISVIVIISEIILGFALLVGFAKKTTLLALIAMTIFFGFLTFYSAYFNKVTDCGCFGDAVKFTPWQSFAKDILLLILVLFLWIGKDYLIPFWGTVSRFLIVIFSGIASVFFSKYTLQHLPLIDFRPYKIGTNIQEGMKIPANAPKPIFNYFWTFKIKGKEQTIVTRGDFPSVDGEFIKVETEKVSEGYRPPIHDFSIEKNNENYTEYFLNSEKLILVITYDLEKTNNEGWNAVKKITDQALKKGYEVIGLTASIDISEKIRKKNELNFDFYFTDQTTLKTIIRANPGLLVLEKGTIKQKANYTDTDKIKL